MVLCEIISQIYEPRHSKLAVNATVLTFHATLIRQDNGAFPIRFSNQRNFKTRCFQSSLIPNLILQGILELTRSEEADFICNSYYSWPSFELQ